MKPLSKNKKIILIAVVAGLVVTGLTGLIEISAGQMEQVNDLFPWMHWNENQVPTIMVQLNDNFTGNLSNYFVGDPDPICHLELQRIQAHDKGFTVIVPMRNLSEYFLSLYRADPRVAFAMPPAMAVMVPLITGPTIGTTSYSNRGLPFPFTCSLAFNFNILNFFLDFLLFFAISLLIVFGGYRYSAWKQRRYQQFKQQPPQVPQQPPVQTLAKRRR